MQSTQPILNSNLPMKKIWLILVIIFVSLNCLLPQNGGTNAQSRYAMLLSLIERQTLYIDNYENLTIDWAQTPDGHYYSNKPPGPMFVAFPVFYILDKIFNSGGDELEKINFRLKHLNLYLFIFSAIFQVLFAVLLSKKIVSQLSTLKVSAVAQTAFIITLFFGTTASLLMNSYFGHTFAALCILAAISFGLERKIAISGFFYGWAALSDYGSAWLVVGFFLYWFASSKLQVKNTIQNIFKLLSGAIIPLILWFWYHWKSFGSPFTFANHFVNPLFKDVNTNGNIMGIFHSSPNPIIAYEILFGETRGILFTMPWLLLVICFSFFQYKQIQLKYFFKFGETVTSTPDISQERTRLTLLLLSGFLGLLLMNTAFGGWHAGATCGPRYLSPCLLGFPLLAAMQYDQYDTFLKRFFWLLILISLLFFCLVMSNTILAEVGPLWPFYIKMLSRSQESQSLFLASFLCISVSLFIVWRQLKSQHQN